MKYPIGPFISPNEITYKMIQLWIEEIESFPNLLRDAVLNLKERQLDTPYREGGWTVRQVVHHCADSHMNSFIRFKLALTENNPTIKGYDEAKWAKLPDGWDYPIESSLKLLEGLHERWVALLKSLGPEDLKKTFFHPEKQKSIPLDQTIALYAWHGKHHLGHVKIVADLGRK
ncbi:YfiT family bacillithiol transferase [Aquiflexum lacus]|uniref:YfiT family bacillithiol transferase n=1 Tax=Aquiflexum lacus TaxID=2483805 RepID=UPI0018958E46|nr:putative metal-dependent hydrolase [Aquiflexum lacus]